MRLKVGTLHLHFQGISRDGKSVLGPTAKSESKPASFRLIDAPDQMADRATLRGIAGKDNSHRRDLIRSTQAVPMGGALQNIAIGKRGRGGNRFESGILHEIDFAGLGSYRHETKERGGNELLPSAKGQMQTEAGLHI